MKKRIISLVLVLVMAVGSFLSFYVAKAATYGDLEYEVVDGEVIITGCNTSVTSVDIPSKIEGYPVTKIDNYAFYGYENLASVEVPDSVITIGNYAFCNCKNLASISIGEGVTSIGDGAFEACKSLTSIAIPDSVNSIGASVFYGCEILESISIPDGVTTIGNYAFRECKSLVSISLPDSVTEIGNYAFYNCWNLVSIEVSDSLASIGNWAFYSCDIESIELPDSVTSIGDNAFMLCDRLESIEVPDSVTTIGDYAFYCCPGLQDSDGFVIVKDVLFDYYGDSTSITIPDNVTAISNYAFSYCDSLESIMIPDSVTTIGDGAFSRCYNLESITIPDSVTTIGDYAFSWCRSLESITIPDSVTAIGERAFELCGVTNAVIGNKVTTIVYGTFASCTNLESVTLPDSVTAIDEYAFEDCTGISTVNYGGSETDRDNMDIAEDGNTSLLNATWVYSPDAETPVTSGTCGENLSWSFDEETGTLTIDGTGEMDYYELVLAGNSDEGIIGVYFADYPWFYYDITSVVINAGVTSIAAGAFSDLENLTSVTIPDSLVAIDDWAFAFCTRLESITIPESVVTIDDSVFYKCTSLTSIIIPESVTTIGDSVFKGCEGLQDSDGFVIVKNVLYDYYGSATSIEVPDSVTSISTGAFQNCTALASIIIPDSVTEIGEQAFYECTNLSTVNYGGSEADRANIDIVEDGNTYLLNATWNYHEHTYDNACDTDCNTCGKVRTTTHSYGEYVSDNNATTEKDGTKTRVCTVCGAKDTVTDVGSKLPIPEEKPDEKPEEKPEEKPVEIKDTTKIFTDVKAKKWYTNAVNYAYSHGFIAGVSDNEFGRDVPVTRGMFITILARIAGVDTSSKANKVTTKFTDVKSGKYYTNAIKWASENGVVNGLTDTTFGPNNAIERQQLCTMIVNFAKYMKIDLKATQTEIKFADATSIRKYAKTAVATCQKAGVVSGYAVDGGTEFKPLNTATRAEAAQILYKFHKDFVA